jgi:nucleolar protein 53
VKRKAGNLSHDEKTRLLRIGKRMRKGPLNSYVDPTEFGAGSAILEVSKAVKESGKYDPWASIGEEDVKDGMETVKKVAVKVTVVVFNLTRKIALTMDLSDPTTPIPAM